MIHNKNGLVIAKYFLTKQTGLCSPDQNIIRPHRFTKRECRTGCKPHYSSLVFQPNPCLSS